MLIGISGSLCAGKSEIARYLTLQGFTRLKLLNDSTKDATASTETLINPPIADEQDETKSLSFSNVEELIHYVTLRWRENYVITNIWTSEILSALSKRPFFLHISVDAPVTVRWSRYCNRIPDDCERPTLEQFVNMSDHQSYAEPNGIAQIMGRSSVTIINRTKNLELFYMTLSNVNLTDPTRLRPSWDAYFMRLANLAALRSNCMKRQVGCVLVRDKRVIATGYNGTPRGLVNCNEGGCKRCNTGNGSGADLGTCLCLHAEENALLEAGRDRVGNRSILYCNTCPCLTCSIKIVQTGIQEVVYSQSYSMDSKSAEVFRNGGILLRQYSPPSEGLIV